MKPYFPAIEQLQSVNLRAALLRGLENAKKNGALGRDALIRKTMLDECKGERFEEVLASFSSGVLRSTVSDPTKRTRPLAAQAALDSRGSSTDLLRPMIIAHRASLKRGLEQKKEADAKFRDFDDLLAMKERGIARRNEVLRARQAAAPAGVPEDARWTVRRAVRNNWSGNESWMDTLLVGDAAGRDGKGLLGTPYDRVWRRVQQGRLAELEDDGRGLLHQLEGRVDAQKQRLARWDELRRHMAGGKHRQPVSPMKRKTAPKTESKGIDLRFNSHKELNAANLRGLPSTRDAKSELHKDYAVIIQELDNELTEISTNSFDDAVQRLVNLRAQYGQPDVSVNLSSDPISELSDLGDMDEEHEQEPEPYYRQPASRARPTSIYTDPAAHALHRSESDRSYGAPQSEDGYSSASTSRQTSQRGNLRQQYFDGENSPTQGVSDYAETLSRSSNSPSPTKRSKPRHTLSLAERTRMSMARRSMQFLEDEEPELPLRPAASNRGHRAAEATASPADEEEDEIGDLASRTRKSMMGFEKAQQKARLDRQREMRKEMRKARALPPRKEGSQWED